MKRIPLYDKIGLRTEDEVFDYFFDSISPVAKSWDYFVDWGKVFSNSDRLDEKLEPWNRLIGSHDFAGDFRAEATENPGMVEAIPFLIPRDGARSKVFEVTDGLSKSRYDFSEPASDSVTVNAALEFVLESGLAGLFQSERIRNVHDYMIGVEAGIDTNGRKNRGGTTMELMVAKHIETTRESNDFEFTNQATNSWLKENWNIDLELAKGRRFDFAIRSTPTPTFIEVNAYNGGGSKLKATAGEYAGLQHQLRDSRARFIWVTDGLGWKSARGPLRQAFAEIDYVFNLSMLEQGSLNQALQYD